MTAKPSTTPPANERTIGLVGATGVGVGAIVGGGILVLAGVALRSTGPSAILAFALNGFIAVLTALSFAEMSAAFPESGGAYTFAKKVLDVRSAFGVGWILWFAYIVAGVLYALGFASFALATVRALWETAPAWLDQRTTVVAVALAPTGVYTLSLIRKATGGGEWATWGKVVVFVVLILAGAWAFIGRGGEATQSLSPFFAKGFGGLVQAMGFTFIALQGFDLIAAIAGEVKSPARVIPRAMLLSLGAALVIYIPLLFIVSTVGVESGGSIVAMSEAEPDTVMATAVRNYMGPVGFWLVMVAAMLSTLSALSANLLAASRIALSMAGDRTLPVVLGQRHKTLGTPVMAIYASALALTTILLMVPDVAAAGAAASLIFLVAFALAHLTSILARRRSRDRTSVVLDPVAVTDADRDVPAPSFQTPWFPAVPVVGGLACMGMAIFQGVTVPAAGGIAVVWLGLGVLLYFALFSGRAQTFDAFTQAMDPALVRLRGHSPLVLVPVANPQSAGAMVSVAAAIAPPKVGRVMLLNVMRPPQPRGDDDPPESIQSSQLVVGEALRKSLEAGHKPEALITIAHAPWPEIGRVAQEHRCEGLLLGLTQALEKISGGHLEELLNAVPGDFTFLKSPDGWNLSDVRRVLVPVGGRGGHVELRARLLGSLDRDFPRESTWLQVISPDATDAVERETKAKLTKLAADHTFGLPVVAVERSLDPVRTIVEHAGKHDLLVIGLQRQPDGRRVFGEFALRVAREAPCAVIMVSRGGAR